MRITSRCCSVALLFFFTDPATTEIYTLSLHDALPIYSRRPRPPRPKATLSRRISSFARVNRDRKSTRLNSSHEWISYAVFCLKKKISWPLHTQKQAGPTASSGRNDGLIQNRESPLYHT